MLGDAPGMWAAHTLAPRLSWPSIQDGPFPSPLPLKCQKATHLLPWCGWEEEWWVLTSAWCEDWSTAAMEPEELGSASLRASSMFSWRGEQRQVSAHSTE